MFNPDIVHSSPVRLNSLLFRMVVHLVRFKRPGGLETSTVRTGNQWDAPFGWGPLEIIAVQGLRRYGYDAEADRITGSFCR